MAKKDEIAELKARIKELEEEVEGAIVLMQSFAPILEYFGQEGIKLGENETGSAFIVMGALVKMRKEACHKIFKDAFEKQQELLNEHKNNA